MIHQRSASSDSTLESAQRLPESPSRRTTQLTRPRWWSCYPKVQPPTRRRGLALPARSTGCTSTPCWHVVAMGKTPADSAASTAPVRTIQLPPTTVLSPRGRRWPTTAHRLRRLRLRGSSTPCRLLRSHRRAYQPALTTSSTGSTGCVRAWHVFGRCRGLAASTGQVGERFWCRGSSCCCLRHWPC